MSNIETIKQKNQARCREWLLRQEEYHGENNFWWVKILDAIDPDGEPRCGHTSDVTIRYGRDSWVADLGWGYSPESVLCATHIIGLHNRSLVRRIRDAGLTVDEYQRLLRERKP